MLYLGACIGVAPPPCQSCGCDPCTAWMLTHECGAASYSQEFQADFYPSATVSVDGGVEVSTCGTAPCYPAYAFADLAVSLTLPMDISEFRYCGVKPYTWVCDAPECNINDFSALTVSVSGQSVDITAASITLTLGNLCSTAPTPDFHVDGIMVIGTCVYDGQPAYCIIYANWRFDGTAGSVYVVVLGPCVPTSTCPDESTAYSQGYDVGYACGTSEPPPDCPPDVVSAYEAGHADGWIDGACGA